MNICQEISVPGCFINFRGKNNKNAIQNETGSFTLGFGEKSEFDEATLNIFKEFTAKSEDKLYNGEKPRDYFSLIQDFDKVVQALDKKFVWEKALNSDQNLDLILSEIGEALNRWTALVFGECGQGKSTILNEIV